jgi:hypothetical protein
MSYMDLEEACEGRLGGAIRTTYLEEVLDNPDYSSLINVVFGEITVQVVGHILKVSLVFELLPEIHEDLLGRLGLDAAGCVPGRHVKNARG